MGHRVAAKRIADFVVAPAGVFAQDEHASLAAQLVDAGAVMSRHRENQIRLLDQLAREQPGPVPGEIEAAFESDQIRPFRRRCAIPGARPGGRDRDFEAALLERALEQRGGERAAADVAGADEQHVLDHGARRPTARRSSLTLSVPSRTISARGLVQSTTVDGGRFPNTPPSSTSSWPFFTAGASADALKASPCDSAIDRSLINKRKGLAADRPLSAASAATSSCTTREPRP